MAEPFRASNRAGSKIGFGARHRVDDAARSSHRGRHAYMEGSAFPADFWRR
jgi:hypothetical protein